MPTIRHHKTSLLTSLLLVLSTGITLAQQMNYQGRLTDSAGNAVGDAQYFIAFDIYDAATGGNEVWGPETNAVDTVQGRFNVILGPTDATARNIINAFNGGTPRYLQITFQGNPILPRQQILAAPVSFRAYVADTVTNGAIGTLQLADGSVTAAKINGGTGVWTGSGTNIYHVGGNIGINTSTPTNALQVNGAISARDTTATNGYVAMWLGSPVNAGWLEWWKPGPLRLAYLGYSTGGINNLGLNLENSANFMINGGNVGIGLFTGTPTSTLDVGGSIHASTSIAAGTTVTAGGNITANGKVATVGEETLKIVRGTINSDGSFSTGGGYTSSRTSTGKYSISFSTAFSGTPTVTANPAPGHDSTGYTFCQVDSASASSIVIEMRGTDGGYYDEPIGFIAVGPR
jgi:hypothetical protein